MIDSLGGILRKHALPFLIYFVFLSIMIPGFWLASGVLTLTTLGSAIIALITLVLAHSYLGKRRTVIYTLVAWFITFLTIFLTLGFVAFSESGNCLLDWSVTACSAGQIDKFMYYIGVFGILSLYGWSMLLLVTLAAATVRIVYARFFSKEKQPSKTASKKAKKKGKKGKKR